jgi:predicted GH43/DUF377 family glycosyl hydrolase
MVPFQLERLGVLMEPEAGNPNEVEGVLNPAVARGRDGQLYLFPRLVAKGNYSRIGMARVLFDKAGEPTGVERMGMALEPEADYELAGEGRGGCEDPRITYLEPLGHYIMTYTALTPRGPRIAIARSDDLFKWERLGLAKFRPYEKLSFDGIDDKDASIFPTLVPDPSGKPSVALIHRPLFFGTRPEEMIDPAAPAPASVQLQTIWLAYWHMDDQTNTPKGTQFVAHRRLAQPAAPWEKLKIGGGAPPIPCRHGWLLLYHGVQAQPTSTPDHPKMFYSAGVMVLNKDHPERILYRSPSPVLAPELPQELIGAVDGVIFPTGVDRRDDIGQPDRFDVYYGMADDRIGVARMVVPETLP